MLTTIVPFQSINCKSENHKDEDLCEGHGECLTKEAKWNDLLHLGATIYHCRTTHFNRKEQKKYKYGYIES